MPCPPHPPWLENSKKKAWEKRAAWNVTWLRTTLLNARWDLGRVPALMIATTPVTQVIHVRCTSYKLRNRLRTISARAANNCNTNKKKLWWGLLKHRTGRSPLGFVTIWHLRMLSDVHIFMKLRETMKKQN
jgi:hypothetical protein